MSLIQLNYELAIAQAKRLEQAASDCRTMAKEVNNQISALQDAWSGEAADAMIEKLTAWSKDTATMETTLNDLASRIRKKANALLAADEAADAAAAGAKAASQAAAAIAENSARHC